MEEKKDLRKDDVKELDLDMINDVTGAGDPFADIPRVPLQEIDEELREKA